MAADHPILGLPLSPVFRRRRATSRRSSSYDRTGANDDFVSVGPGERMTLLEHEGAGCITHVYCAMILPDIRDYRNAILRCYWDGESVPSVEVPLGDFFGVAHGRIREVSSSLVSINAGYGGSHGLNAYFPMPFSSSALVTLENRGSTTLGGPFGALWYHIEFETYEMPLDDDVHRFHASYRQEHPTTAVGDEPNVTLHDAINDTGAENFVALDTEGDGSMIGLLLEIDNIQGTRWYGEGDDMVFIDGEVWPPSIHGTGTEEIFGGGASPSSEYAAPYSGFHLIQSPAFDGLVGMYRWFLNDPILFRRSLRWTVEHGHANNFSNDYSSIAYWYQTPQAELPALPAAAAMLPPLDDGYEEVRVRLFAMMASSTAPRTHDEALRLFMANGEVATPFYRGEFDRALELLEEWAAR